MTLSANKDPNTDGQDLVELMFFAYRDFTGDPDQILSELGFGRAHHRVLHFVSTRPGLTVAELLDVLGITKQSLARVLKNLVDENYIDQQEGPHDRRQRQLHLTEQGAALIARLRQPQSRRIKSALEKSGLSPDQAAAFLHAMGNAGPGSQK